MQLISRGQRDDGSGSVSASGSSSRDPDEVDDVRSSVAKADSESVHLDSELQMKLLAPLRSPVRMYARSDSDD